jgi:hypothetical protein
MLSPFCYLLVGLDKSVELVGVKPNFTADADGSKLARLDQTVHLFLTELKQTGQISGAIEAMQTISWHMIS